MRMRWKAEYAEKAPREKERDTGSEGFRSLLFYFRSEDVQFCTMVTSVLQEYERIRYTEFVSILGCFGHAHGIRKFSGHRSNLNPQQ